MRELILFVVIGLIIPVYAYGKVTKLDVESAMQDKRFDEALIMIDALIVESKESIDYLLYLKALSLFYSNSFEDSIITCDKIIDNYSNSTWHRKAIFLKMSVSYADEAFRTCRENI